MVLLVVSAVELLTVRDIAQTARRHAGWWQWTSVRLRLIRWLGVLTRGDLVPLGLL